MTLLNESHISIYFELKKQGLSDKVIAERYFRVGTDTLNRWKRKHGIRVGYANQHNVGRKLKTNT